MHLKLFLAILRKMIEVVLTSVHLALKAQVKTRSQHAQKKIHLCLKKKKRQIFLVIYTGQLI